MELTEKFDNCVKDNKAIFVYADNHKEIKRIFKANGIRAEYRKGSNRKGHEIDFNNVIDIQPVKKTDLSVLWVKSIDKAIKLLSNSGLWADLLISLKTAKDIGFDKLQKADVQYWAKETGDYTKDRDINTQKIKVIDERLVKQDENKKDYVNTEIVWYMDKPLKIKKMYFGYLNEGKLKEISEAMKNKQKIEVTGRANLDIGFEYNSELNQAWYREEFKDCGNGHYYLALNNEYAVFWDDD